MENNYKISGGLIATKPDNRDFHLGAIGVNPTVVPDIDFIVRKPLEIKDQNNSDLCTSFASCECSEAQEEVLLAPEYTFAKTKQIIGNWQDYGADLRSACKAAITYGFLEKPSPITLDVNGRNFCANWENWTPEDDIKAYPHRKQSYFMVDGLASNIFDSIRNVLWQYKSQQILVLTGVTWRHEWTYAAGGIIPEKYGSADFGHAFVFIGQKIINGYLYLVAQLSNGPNIGDKGLFYFSKTVVNNECIYNNYAFIDLPLEMTKEQVADKSAYLNKGIFGRVFFHVGNYFKEIIA